MNSATSGSTDFASLIYLIMSHVAQQRSFIKSIDVILAIEMHATDLINNIDKLAMC